MLRDGWLCRDGKPMLYQDHVETKRAPNQVEVQRVHNNIPRYLARPLRVPNWGLCSFSVGGTCSPRLSTHYIRLFIVPVPGRPADGYRVSPHEQSLVLWRTWFQTNIKPLQTSIVLLWTILGLLQTNIELLHRGVGHSMFLWSTNTYKYAWYTERCLENGVSQLMMILSG